LLPHAGREVLLNLLLGQSPIVDCDEAHDTRPGPIVTDLVSEHERETVVPLSERAAAPVLHARIFAVDVDTTATDWIERHDDVLQSRLQPLLVVERRQLRFAVPVRRSAAGEEL